MNKSEDGKQVGRFVDLTVGSLEIPYLTVSIFSSKYEARSSAKEQGGREATGDVKTALWNTEEIIDLAQCGVSQIND